MEPMAQFVNQWVWGGVGGALTNALLLIIFRTANAFPDSLCSANFAFKFSKNPSFDLALIELLLS